ncbi:MAG: DUF928 domain-containing protein [Heteroscytonema crispum UTEX LB 1556]
MQYSVGLRPSSCRRVDFGKALKFLTLFDRPEGTNKATKISLCPLQYASCLSIKLAFIIPLLSFSLANYPSQAQAQLVQPDFSQSGENLSPNLSPPRRKALDFSPFPTKSGGWGVRLLPRSDRIYLSQLQFPDNGAPKGRRRGGTGRDGCPDFKPPITALVPGDKNNKSFLGLTVAEYPTFWVYVPELPATVKSGEFIFQDEQNNDIWRTEIGLSGKPGAIAISLPATPQYALKPNSKYHWYFKVYCGQPQNKAEYFYVDAWVQRVAVTSNLLQQLKTAKMREYSVYAANQIWYDAVNNLAQLRQKNSSDRLLTEDWNKLLKSVGLEDLATAPIVKYYSQEK